VIHTVLIAEQDPFELARLEAHCRDAGLRVLTAGDGEQVLSSIARERPDTLLMRYELPRLSGLEVLGILRSDPMLEGLWVIMIVDVDETSHGSQVLQAGADDVVSKPYLLEEVLIRVANRGRRSAPSLPGDEVKTADIKQQRPGGVTALIDALRYELRRASRYSCSVTCMILRIADFPGVIAQGGTVASDTLTDAISTELLETLRNVDYVFQSSAGEFSFVLPETDRGGAESLRQRLADIWLRLPETTQEVGQIQIGYACWDPSNADQPEPEALRQRARDAATTVRKSELNLDR